MNPNPNPSYNIIKGLQIFINDIRSCTTKEAENKRVEKELNKVREKFASGKALTGYEKKKCVWKLLYIYILGYKVDFGHNYAADLITSLKFSEKMTGYIAMSVLCKESNQEINIMINSIRNDLLNSVSLCQSMALTLATNLNNQELLETIAQDVLKFMTSFNEKQLYTVKKALICLTKVIKVKKEVHDAGVWSKYLSKMLEMKNFEVMMALAGLILNIFQIFGTAGYEELTMKFFNHILYKMKECPEEYVYYHIKAPWLQIKILKIIQHVNPSVFDQNTVNHIKDYVDYVGKKTHTIAASESKYTRFYAEYCIFFEVINLIDHFNLKLHHKTFDTYVGILGLFLQDDHRKHPNKDVNTKYLALDNMAKLSKYTSGNKILKEHSNIILYSLRDNDVSIRRRALDLLFLCCTNESVQMICKELLLYFKEDEPQLKKDVALKIAILAEKYANDFSWYIDVCLKMLEVAGDYVSDDIIHRIVQIVIGFENQETHTQLQVYACEKIIKLLEKDYVYESIVRLAGFILGEFGYMLERVNRSNSNTYNDNDIDGGVTAKSLSKQIDLLLKHTPICSNPTLYVIFNCLMKFININNNLRMQAVPIFEQYVESWDPELQQRAIEYLILAKMDGEDSGISNISEIRAKLFDKMPAYNQEIFNNSVLMKRLKQTQSGLYSNSSKVDSTQISQTSTSKSYNDNAIESNLDNVNRLIASSESNTENRTNPYADHILYQKDPNGFAVNMNRFPDYAVPVNKEILSNNFDLFKSLVSNPNPNGGLIYSDQNIKVDCKIKMIQGSTGVLGVMFNFIPMSSDEKIDDIEFQLANYHTNELINVQISKVKYPDGVNSNYPQILMKVQLVDSFSTPPTVNLNCRIGMMKINTTFALPVVVTKYLEPFDTSVENFTALWYEYSNSPEEIFQKMDAVLYNPMANNYTIMDFLKKFGGLMTNLQFKVFPPLDRENFHELEGVAVLHEQDKQKIPILFQASFVPSHMHEFRFSLRSKNTEVEKFSSLLLDIYSIVKFYINPA